MSGRGRGVRLLYLRKHSLDDLVRGDAFGDPVEICHDSVAKGADCDPLDIVPTHRKTAGDQGADLTGEEQALGARGLDPSET